MAEDRDQQAQELMREGRLASVKQHGLEVDILNDWEGLHMLPLSDLLFEHLSPFLHYEEYLAGMPDQETSRQVLALSRPESIRAYNDLEPIPIDHSLLC